MKPVLLPLLIWVYCCAVAMAQESVVSTQAFTPPQTWRDRWVSILPTQQNVAVPVTAPRPITLGEQALALIESTIRESNPDGIIRRPVSGEALKTLCDDLHSRSVPITLEELSGVVDRASQLIREAPDESLAEKLERTLDRPTIHGNVVEFAEARARNMVLTKNSQSQHYDLTETTPRPRNLQMKWIANPGQALKSMQEDWAYLPSNAPARGVMPRDQLDELAARGKLTVRNMSNLRTYHPVEGPRGTIFASEAFDTYAEGREYSDSARTWLQRFSMLEADDGGIAGPEGRFGSAFDVGTGLWMIYSAAPMAVEAMDRVADPQTRDFNSELEFGKSGSLVLAGSGFLGAGIGRFGELYGPESIGDGFSTMTKLGGRVGWGLIGVTEVFTVAEYERGQISWREFASSQASLGGGLGGGFFGSFGGYWIGAPVGSAIASFVGPEGAPIGWEAGGNAGQIIGGFVGGWFGSKAADSAVNSYFTGLDAQEEAKVRQDITARYIAK